MSENLQAIHKHLMEYANMLISEDGYIYAGYPRFMDLFGRDSIIYAVELFNINSGILKKTLITLSEKQGKQYNRETREEPGKILHEIANFETFRYYPLKEKWVKPGIPLYHSIDSTPLFLLACKFYIKNIDDADFLNHIKVYMERAVSWMLERSGKTGFLTYNTAETWNKLASQGWMVPGAFMEIF